MKGTIFILATLLGIGNMSRAVAQNTENIIPGVSIGKFNIDPAVDQRRGFSSLAVDRYLRTPSVLLLCTKRYKYHFGRVGEGIPSIGKTGTIGV